jgi:A/G-specific adenine glycosylase
VSEIMLQQTQVKTVIPYFQRFTASFPDIITLANAHEDEVLHHWSGLGYYARARNLHKTSKIISTDYKGVFPEQIEVLISLPGIGRSTAGAILSLSMNQRHPILDGNVKRVFTRYNGIIGWPGERKIEDKLWLLAEQFTPVKEVATYTQAIMDLGATLCTRSKPLCTACPVMKGCFAYENNQQLILPSRRKKKTLPIKQAIFTIIENKHGEVLLEKRPPAGIWGGLWSFPECPVDEDLSKWIKKHYGSTVSGLKEQKTLRHTFSHFHLDIRPVRARLNKGSIMVKDQGDIIWYNPEGKSKLGMAAPVTRITSQLAKERK